MEMLFNHYAKFRNIFRKICMFFVYLSSIGIPFILFFQVVFRYLVKRPVLGLEELTVFLMLLLTVFGSVVLFFDKKHIVVDTLLMFLPDKAKKVLCLLNDFLVFIILGFMIKSSLLAIPLQKVYKSVVLGIPKALTTSIFLVTLVILLIDFLINILITLKDWSVASVDK